jgi:UDP-N-acetylmuramoyl-tripeptide--D-alanyl-D-alanine ligase
MPTFSPEFLARATGGVWTRRPERGLTGFTQDTRTLQRGDVFVALRTERRDGHAFLAEARAKGAAAALVARASPDESLPQLVVADPLLALQTAAREHRRRFRGPVIGISGSAGKTSTKNLLAQLLGGEPRVLATRGTLNNHLGVPLTLLRLDPQEHAYAVVEAGISGPGDMPPLAAMIEPDLAIITMVGPAHLEALGSLEGVAREKAELPRAARVAVFPAECRQYAAFRDLTVSSVRAEQVEDAAALREPIGAERARYLLSRQAADMELRLSAAPDTPFTMGLVSDGLARNAVLALLVALRLGLPIDSLRRRLAEWRSGDLRAEVRRSGDRLVYVDCYNANPASMADALDAFVRVAPAAAARFLVLGAMEELGVEAERHHRELGRRLPLRPGDLCCFVGGYGEAVRAGAADAGMDPQRIELVADSASLAPRVAAFRGSIFVKGSRRHALERALGEAGH